MQFYAHFDTIDLRKEIADERMALNENKSVEECLVVSEHETR